MTAFHHQPKSSPAPYCSHLPSVVSDFFGGLRQEGKAVYLPPTQLDHVLYSKFVKPALEKLGGKWNARTKRFEFAYVVDDLPARLLEPRAKSLRSLYGYYGTSSALAGELMHFVQESGYDLPDAPERAALQVLEPSAGQGGLLRYWHNWQFTNLHYFELMPENRQVLRECVREGIFGASELGEDFLKAIPTPTFDWVVANPPFRNEVKHVEQMLRFLKPGGMLALIVSPKRYADDRFYSLLKAELETFAMREMESTKNAPLFEHTQTGCVLVVGRRK